MLENGFYLLFDDQGQRYLAYCDLASEPGAAWTLVISWTRSLKNLPQFRSKSFVQDAPVNENTPNWYSYRQTLARMKNIRSRSTHWRATCSFNMVEAIDYRDYIRGRFRDFDIMAFSGKGVCFPVEYVDIRGSTAGKGTTLPFFQGQDREFLHTDSTFTGCEFKPNVSSAVASEDNFGLYNDVNVKFRCTVGDYSTTQWWFGGYLTK